MLDDANQYVGMVIRAARAVPARPDQAFRAFTDPALVTAWWGKTGKAKLTECSIDARAGGSFRLVSQCGDGVAQPVTGRFMEVSPARKLAFSWVFEEVEGKTRDTKVTMDFLDLKDGTTRIVVTHQGLPSPPIAHLYSAGWHDMLQDMTLGFASA